jgi:hypothetical protein
MARWFPEIRDVRCTRWSLRIRVGQQMLHRWSHGAASRVARLLVAVSLIGPAMAHADTVAPGILVLARTNRSTAQFPLAVPSFSILNSGGTFTFCRGRTIDFVASATSDPDGLGVPSFNGTIVTYAWNFGTGTPSTSLDAFSNRATVRFSDQTTVSLQVFDGAGNPASFRTVVRAMSC